MRKLPVKTYTGNKKYKRRPKGRMYAEKGRITAYYLYRYICRNTTCTDTDTRETSYTYGRVHLWITKPIQQYTARSSVFL